jgi:hypothetical protein
MIARRFRVFLRVKLKRAAVYGALLFLATSFGASAQNNPDLGQGSSASPPSGIESQPGGGASSSPGIAHQGNDDATLEISPQTGIKRPAPSSDEIPSNREFRPGDNTDSVNREFRPGEQDLNRGGQVGHGTSCLGITVNYTSYCFKGAEEHGLEVTSIDRNSPAEEAGLKATGDKGGMISAAETASAFLGPLQLLTNHLLEKASQGNRGDLIVAVDDQRIRSQADFNDALAKAHPGDTLYLTVIRPISKTDLSGSTTTDHATMKIAVKVGRWQPGTADSCADSTTASAERATPN